MRAATSCLLACAAALPAPASAGAARVEVDHVSDALKPGRLAHFRVRLAFTGERICRLVFARGQVRQVTPDVLTEHRLVTWRWRVPQDARAGRWKLTAECRAEAEATVRASRRVPLTGAVAGRRVAARRVAVSTSGDPLVVNRP
jgi:hypothetical protein